PTSVGRFTQAEDSYGYRWLLIDDPELEDLVTRVHLANSTLNDAGWGPQLLCSVFGFKPAPGAAPDAKAFFLVYLFKRGTFYPFAPLGRERRDNELELRVKAMMGADLPFESDLARWFPLWDAPVR
ncbi:MAG: PspA-associated protein PspAB, partial [Acidimicrobiales bacterium]